jgi:hypothetical protein
MHVRLDLPLMYVPSYILQLNTHYEEKYDLLNVKASGTHSYQCAVKSSVPVWLLSSTG